MALEYYVEASKRCENCEQQAREEYRAFVVRTTGAGPLDAACKQQLDAEAQRLQIDAATQASILRARQQKARREICRAHLRAACRTGSGRVAPDHGDGARTGAEKPRSPHRAARKFVELRGRLLVFPRAGGRLPGGVGEGL
ncbi:MAG: hypothetical protein ACLUQ6_01695 [Alistipes onderdonkii]